MSGGTDDAAARARAARVRRLQRTALALVHPDARLTRAVADAAIAVTGPVARDAGATLPLRAFAALALGADDTARTLIDTAAAECDDAGAGDVAGITAAWLTARWYAWTGMAGTALPWLERIARCLSRVAPSPADPALADLRRVAARTLIALAEAGPDEGLRRRVRQMAGGADPDRSVDAALGLLRAQHRQPDPHVVLEDLLAGRTATGTADWTTLALAPEADASHWLVPLLVAGLLGIDPDAERGRLRLRLHLPEAWPAWGVDHLRVGPAAVALRVQRDEHQVVVTVDQESGPLPLSIILEPTIQGPVGAAEIDGRPAELALRVLPDRVIVPVQLVLDAPRMLRLQLG